MRYLGFGQSAHATLFPWRWWVVGKSSPPFGSSPSLQPPSLVLSFAFPRCPCSSISPFSSLLVLLRFSLFSLKAYRRKAEIRLVSWYQLHTIASPFSFWFDVLYSSFLYPFFCLKTMSHKIVVPIFFDRRESSFRMLRRHSNAWEPSLTAWELQSVRTSY